MHDRLPVFARYLLAGVGSFVADFAAFLALTAGAHVDPLLAHLVSRPLGGVTSYCLNRRWTFGSTRRVAPEFARFACVFGASLALTEALLALFCRGLGLRPGLGKVLAELTALSVNFLALRHWAFRAAEE